MAIKDSIVNLKKALRTTLTNVPALIDTLVRGLDGVAEAAEEENTYSTDERVVGTWIDGSKIYEKVIDCGALPNATTKTIAHGIERLNILISANIIATNDARTTYIPIPYSSETDLTANIRLLITNTSINIYDAMNYNWINKTYAILRYTKSAVSRTSEKNDTKNDGNEEKNDNER